MCVRYLNLKTRHGYKIICEGCRNVICIYRAPLARRYPHVKLTELQAANAKQVNPLN